MQISSLRSLLLLAPVFATCLCPVPVPAQTVVTAAPPAIDFGTLYPTDFDTQTIVYTCATGPCVGAAPKITGGHTILVSNNTCKVNWTFFVPGQTGDTCSVSWTLKATDSEVNCPENVCTGAVGISVTNGVSNDAIVVTDGYTATIYSAKPVVTVSPKSLDFGGVNEENGESGPLPVTITNVSEVSVNVSYCIDQPNAYPNAEGGNFGDNGSDAGPYCPAPTPGQISLTSGQAATIKMWFFTDEGNCANYRPCKAASSGTLKVWSTSTTPDTSTKTYFEGNVALLGVSIFTAN